MIIENLDKQVLKSVAEELLSELEAFEKTPEFIEEITQTLASNPRLLDKNNTEIFAAVCAQAAKPLIEKLENEGKTPPEVRSQNAKKINQTQKTKYKVLRLLKFFCYPASIKIYRQDEQKEREAAFQKAFNKLETEPDKRTLVLYFRTRSTSLDGESQMDPLEFGMICWILNYYIEHGYSKVFDRLKIVSRQKNQYPEWVQTLSPEIEYSDASGDQFVAESSIGANCVHFSEGLPEQAFYGATPILGVSARRSKRKMKNLSPNDYVRLFLDYNKKLWSIRDVYLEDPIPPQNGSFANVMKEMLRAVQELEEKMINDTNIAPAVIGIKALTRAAIQASHQ